MTTWKRAGATRKRRFALLQHGLPSPYLNMAFPNESAAASRLSRFSGVPEATWPAEGGAVVLPPAHHVREPKRMVLNRRRTPAAFARCSKCSPTRVHHIVRDPYAIFPDRQIVEIAEHCRDCSFRTQRAGGICLLLPRTDVRGLRGRPELVDPRGCTSCATKTWSAIPVGQIHAI